MEATALVVDQNMDTGDRLAYWLATLGVPATLVRSADEAIDSLYDESAPSFVVVSNDLPDMDDFAYFRHEDPLLAHVPLVVVLGSQTREADPRLEPTFVVASPPESPDFILAVATLRDGASWLDSDQIH